MPRNFLGQLEEGEEGKLEGELPRGEAQGMQAPPAEARVEEAKEKVLLLEMTG